MSEVAGDSAQPQAPVRKKRSTQAMFTSSVLCLEAFVVLFAMLAIAGLKTYSKLYVFGGGFLLAAVLIGTCAFIRKPAGIMVGWALQILIIAGGIFMPELFLIGLLFAAAWWYAVNKGRQIDIEVAQRQKEEQEYFEQHKTEKIHPGEPTVKLDMENHDGTNTSTR